MPRIKKPASSATGLWPQILLGLFLGLATLVVPGTIRAHGRNLIPEGSDFEAGWDGLFDRIAIDIGFPFPPGMAASGYRPFEGLATRPRAGRCGFIATGILIAVHRLGSP